MASRSAIAACSTLTILDPCQESIERVAQLDQMSPRSSERACCDRDAARRSSRFVRWREARRRGFGGLDEVRGNPQSLEERALGWIPRWPRRAGPVDALEDGRQLDAPPCEVSEICFLRRK